MISSFITSGDINRSLKELGINENQIINIEKSSECAEKEVFYSEPDPIDKIIKSPLESLLFVYRNKIHEMYNNTKSYLVNDIGIRLIFQDNDGVVIDDRDSPIYKLVPDSILFRSDDKIAIEFTISRDLIRSNIFGLVGKNVISIELYGYSNDVVPVLLSIIKLNNSFTINENSEFTIRYTIDFAMTNSTEATPHKYEPEEGTNNELRR